MTLIPIQDPGLIVLPTHRVLCGLQEFKLHRLIALLENDGRFRIKSVDADLESVEQELPRHPFHAIALYSGYESRTFIVSSKDNDPLATDLPDQPSVWRQLDVAVTHELLVDRMIRPAFGGDTITYKYPHALNTFRELSQSADRLGIVMQATPLQSVCDVAREGGVMPPKSTFFYPKVATGLVINPLDTI